MLKIVLALVSLLCLIAWVIFLALIVGMAVLVATQIVRGAARLLSGAILWPSEWLARRSVARLYRDAGIKR